MLEKALLTREEWLRLAAQGSELGLWYWDETTSELFWDPKTRAIFGVDPVAEMTLDIFYGALHPDDRLRVQQVWRHQLETGVPYELEYRALRKGGDIRWVTARGQGFYDRRGKPRYMVGVVFDVTERKQEESERLELSGRVLAAQEDERRRIAREIHDDFCQRLAVSTMKLQSLAGRPPGSESIALIEDLIGALKDLGHDIQAMSHRLHPAKLDALNLMPSIESLCHEMERDYGLNIAFSHGGIPDRILGDIKLATFRIVQEALHNTVKHSGASKAEVHLRADGDAITLTVSDDGKGFDRAVDALSGGIGIQSMIERARMLGGDLRIETRPAVDGTLVVATMPLGQNRSPSGSS
jgi:PAS domain S-box-containing protein